ncbi:MAG: protein phosphatase CheZ [Acetobacteraceae bacterium]
MPDEPPDDRIEAAVKSVLSTLSGDVTLREATLLAELHELGRTVARAKAEIAALSVDDITGRHIPSATDELDAIVQHTADATNEILDACERIEGIQAKVGKRNGEALAAEVTRIYEACSFQDITGQRIAKVVSALKAIEARIAAATGGAPAEDTAPDTEGRRLAEGPQLPVAATSQDEIDRLLAEFG